MNLKAVWNFIKSKFFWINIGSALLIFLVICTITLLSLKVFTLHGESVKVPNLCGLYTEEADATLKQCGLSYEVVDSVYMRDKLPGEIVDQVPVANSDVK